MSVPSSLRDPGPYVLLTPSGQEPRAVRWGHAWQVDTPAFWIAVTSAAIIDGSFRPGLGRHRLGADLAEEVAACLLGGYGMPYETGLAAFDALRNRGLLAGPSTQRDLELVLSEPLNVGERRVRYRFPRQRARWLAALAKVWGETAPTEADELRNWLMELPGIGPKTAGWVVRNHLGSDEVAIIDVHVRRAGIAAGVFDDQWTAARNYRELEAFFLAWARQGGIAAADLDAVVWASQAQASRSRGTLVAGDR